MWSQNKSPDVAFQNLIKRYAEIYFFDLELKAPNTSGEMWDVFCLFFVESWGGDLWPLLLTWTNFNPSMDK